MLKNKISNNERFNSDKTEKINTRRQTRKILQNQQHKDKEVETVKEIFIVMASRMERYWYSHVKNSQLREKGEDKNSLELIKLCIMNECMNPT